jgi:hypothetical protein
MNDSAVTLYKRITNNDIFNFVKKKELRQRE